MSAHETLYAPRIPYADVLERAREQVVSLGVYRNWALVAPTSGNFNLVDADGTDVVAATAVTVVASIAQYTIPASSLPATLEQHERYQERWSLAIPDGTTRVFRREAAVVKYPLYPVISDDDLTSEYSNLLTDYGGIGSHLQGPLDEAWKQILERFWPNGRWPALVISSSAFRAPHRHLTLHLIFKDLYARSPQSARWERLMEMHGEKFERAWSGMNFKYDLDKDGVADSDDRTASSTVVHRNAAPSRTLRRTARW